MPTPTRNLLNEFKEAVKEIEKQVVKTDNQPNLSNQANLAQNSIKGDGFVTYPNSAKQIYPHNAIFEVPNEIRQIADIGDRVSASLEWLRSNHPEMFKTQRAVKEVIDYVLKEPENIVSPKKGDGVILSKQNDKKMDEIDINQNSEVFHANKRKLNSNEKQAVSGDALPPHLDADNTSLTGRYSVGGKPHLTAVDKNIIPQNAKNEVKEQAKITQINEQTAKAKSEPMATQITKTKETTKAEPTQETFDILKIDKNISDEQVETLLKEIEDKNLKVNLPLRDEEPLGKAFQKNELGYSRKRLLNLALNEQFLKRHKGFIERAEKTQSKAEFQKFLKENKAEVVEYIKDMVTNTLRYIDAYGEGYHFTNKSSLRRANDMILNLQNGKNFYFYNKAPNKITNPAPKSDYADKLVDGNEAIQGTYKLSDEIKQDLIKSLKEFVGARQNLADNIADIQSKWSHKIKEQERLAPSILEGSKKANNGYDENLKKALEHELYLFNQFERKIVKNPQKTSSDLELAKNYYRFSKGDTYTKQALDEINQTRQLLEQELNIRPIKEFGTNYAEFYHDGANAIKKLLTERQGQVAGAFNRQELGDIDLVWGEVTDAIKHKGYGLSHILDKRIYQYMQQGLSKEEAKQKAIELINKLPDIIKNGEIIKKPNEAIQIITDDTKIVLKSNYYGEPTNKWIVTAYERLEKDLDISAKPITKGTNSPLNSKINSTPKEMKSQDQKAEQQAKQYAKWLSQADKIAPQAPDELYKAYNKAKKDLKPKK